MRYEWLYGPATVKNEDDLNNVIIEIAWQCVGFDDATNLTYKTSGMVQAPPPDPGTFVPFDQITQSQVQTWVYADVDKTSTENELLAQSQIAPDVLPFSFQ